MMIVPGIFLMFWGAMFGGVPLFILLSESITPDGFTISGDNVMLIPFVIIGIIVFICGLKMILKILKYKRIEKEVLKNGIEGQGKYIEMTSSYSSNGVRFFKIKFSYIDENRTTQIVTTPSKYRFEQADFYKSLGIFDIKYKGQNAVITQPVDYSLLKNNINGEKGSTKENTYYHNSNNTYPDDNRTNLEPNNERSDYDTRSYSERTTYYCEYCGSAQTTPGKCKYCGGRVKKEKNI